MKTSNRKNILILYFTLVVVMLGFGMVMPIFPFLLDRLGGSGDEYGLLIALYSITQFIFAPLWGSLSDRIGRKPVLLIGMLGNGLTLLLFGFASEIWMLFVGRMLSGLLSSAMLPTTMAYIGDSTAEEDRGGGIGQLGAATGLGIILGPALGGWLAGDSLTTPFFIAAGLSLASLALIALLLPESLSLPQKPPAGLSGRPGGWMKPAGGLNLREAQQAGRLQLVNLRELGRALSGPLGILLVMALLVSLGAINFQAIFGLYAMTKFGYGPDKVGMILTVAAVVGAVIQGTLTGPLTKRWGEVAVIRVALLTNAVGFIVLLTANSYLTVLLTTGFYTLSHTLLRPAVQALTSRRAGLEQGAAMGLNSSFMSLGQIAGPIWAGFAFDVNVAYPYLSGAVIMFVGFLVSLRWITANERISESANERISESV